MDKATNRRGALMSLVKATAGVSALGIACSVSQCTAPAHGAAPTTATVIDRLAWDRAMRIHDQAKATNAALSARWTQIDERYQRICDRAASRIEWKNLSGGILQSQRRDIMWRSDLDQLERSFADAHGKTWWAPDPDARKAAFREGIAQIRRWRRAREEATRRLGYDLILEQSDAACDAYSAAEGALIAMPAPDNAALLWKLEKIIDDCDGTTSPWSVEYVAPVLADARRLLSREG